MSGDPLLMPNKEAVQKVKTFLGNYITIIIMTCNGIFFHYTEASDELRNTIMPNYRSEESRITCTCRIPGISYILIKNFWQTRLDVSCIPLQRTHELTQTSSLFKLHSDGIKFSQ